MLICDAHADTLYALQEESRAVPCDITGDRMRAGGHTRVQAMALWTGRDGLRGSDAGLVERELRAAEHLEAQGFRRIRRVAEAEEGTINYLLTIEGGEMFEPGPTRVDTFAELGVRIVAPVWNNANALAYPAGDARGLTDYGKQIVRRMNALHIAADVSHMSEAGFADVLRVCTLPPIATHTGCRALLDHPRNLTDAQLKAIFAAGGFVGVYFYPPFLCGEQTTSMDTVVEHLEHMARLGGAKHIGFGSDFDGIETYVEGLEHPGLIDALLERLRLRGFDEEAVADIAGENFKRYVDAL